ncbi:MAG: hypothetical protein AB7S55_08700 [Thiomonas sp.]
MRWHDTPESTWLCPELEDIVAWPNSPVLHWDLEGTPQRIDVSWNGVQGKDMV